MATSGRLGLAGARRYPSQPGKGACTEGRLGNSVGGSLGAVGGAKGVVHKMSHKRPSCAPALRCSSSHLCSAAVLQHDQLAGLLIAVYPFGVQAHHARYAVLATGWKNQTA
jgi:hypothetical protein